MAKFLWVFVLISLAVMATVLAAPADQQETEEEYIDDSGEGRMFGGILLLQKLRELEKISETIRNPVIAAAEKVVGQIKEKMG